ncbi:MAG: acyltransferase family protein [Candidatus Weimeria sp.]
MKRIQGLDGLRAIAIIGIIIYHLLPSFLPGGFLGVNLFFVLSGFLLTYTSLNDIHGKGFTVLNFYKKRILRIYPALILLVLTGCFFAWIFTPNAMYGMRREVLSVFLGYNNWWQISRNASYFARISSASPFTHLWCIAVELQYYLVWPLLLMICLLLEVKAHFKSEYFLLILAAISFVESIILLHPGQDPTRVYYGTDTRAYALLVGSALGFIIERKMRTGNRRMKQTPALTRAVLEIALCASFLVMLVFYFFAEGQSILTYRVFMPLTVLISVCVIYLCADTDLQVICLPKLDFLQKLGAYSYEAYLVMFPVISIVTRTLRTASRVPVVVISVVLIILGTFWLHQVTTGLFKKEKPASSVRRYEN